MGVVLRQTSRNTLIIFLGFFFGGINVLFLYTHFLTDDYYGLVTFLLSTANILMPLLVFGMQHTIIKFYSKYQTDPDRDHFLISAVVLPFLIILPLAFIGALFYNEIAGLLSEKNIIIRKYTWMIYVLAVFMGYFEVFYAWSRVQMQSVFGNAVRELFARVSIGILLVTVFLGWINEEQFVYAIAVVYFLRMLIMLIYALKLYRPKLLNFRLPPDIKEILRFSVYIIMAGSAGTLLLEIDKFMIPQLKEIANVAYYAVGVYIASVIAIPSRAMQQIVNPITAKAINRHEFAEVENLYKKSSINLLITGGLLFLLINLNVKDLYAIIGKPEYTAGIAVVFIISLSELIKLAAGTNSAILTNSKYYKVLFYLSIAMALSVIVLNRFLIDKLGINGAALATLIVVFVFTVIRVAYVYQKLHIQPASKKTWQIILLILLLYLIFFKIDFFTNLFLNIALKSVIVTFAFVFVVYKLKISDDLHQIFNNTGFKTKK